MLSFVQPGRRLSVKIQERAKNMSEKVIMLGNQAFARGAYEAGVKVSAAYPGTPSTEISENLVKYPGVYAEWSPNEKVAMEVAIGASISGVRAMASMKHVGVNVAADPLYTVSYIGATGGLVLVAADDPGMYSSQNEQDTRMIGRAAGVPVLEPSDSQEAKDFMIFAFDMSEKYDTPVIVRSTTRLSHSQGLVELLPRREAEDKPYTKNIAKHVMMPAKAIPRHVHVEQRTKALMEDGCSFPINRVELKDTKIGVITSGIPYQYVKEALPEASVLKLGMVNPLPVKLIKDFASKVKRLVVIEELDDIIETHCLKNGIPCEGKNLFPVCGEFSQSIVRKALTGEENSYISVDCELPPRPPVLCAGCPHRGLFYALKDMKLFVSGDIGCYTLAAQAPLAMIDTCVCMGASVSGLHGFNIARGRDGAKNSVAVIGDSTFCHSGVTGLMDIAYNQGISTVIVLDNSITGMTGHQNNPANGLTIKGDPTVAVNLEALAHALGINSVRVVDPFDIENVRKTVAEELEKDEPSLVISRRPCALLKNVKHKAPVTVNEKCIGCKACLRVGCPALSQKDGRAAIDATQCVGCGVCASACRFGAIV